VPEFHSEAPLATASEGLAQGPYVAARAGFELATLRTKGVESTYAPPRPTNRCFKISASWFTNKMHHMHMSTQMRACIRPLWAAAQSAAK